MHRTMHVLKGLGPEEGAYYDHPFFGQLFLAGVLGSIGYPHSLNLSNGTNSVSMIYLIPRILMGLLAVADTFLVYKIAGTRYGKNVALVSAALFSVMPITWIFRRILLDSILLPFLLLSILAALRSKDSKHGTWWVLLSGACIGLAIFTDTGIYHDATNWQSCFFLQPQAAQGAWTVAHTSNHDSTCMACPKCGIWAPIQLDT